MHIAIWVITALLVALWSAVCWALGSLLAMDGSWVAAVGPWLQTLPFGGWLEGWFPEWLAFANALLQALQAMLSWLGAAAPVLVGVLWAAVTGVLVLLAALLSLVVALVRRSVPQPAPAAAG